MYTDPSVDAVVVSAWCQQCRVLLAEWSAVWGLSGGVPVRVNLEVSSRVVHCLRCAKECSWSTWSVHSEVIELYSNVYVLRSI